MVKALDTGDGTVKGVCGRWRFRRASFH